MSIDVINPAQDLSLYGNLINPVQDVNPAEDTQPMPAVDPKVVHQLLNFIVNTYRISMEMEDKASEYIKGAKNKEKDIEELWKTSNKAKVKEMRDKAAIYKQAAVTSAVILALQVATGAAGATMSLRPGASIAMAEFGKLLSKNGSDIASTCNQISGNLTQNKAELSQALIESLQQNSQSIWEADRTDAQARKSELDQLQEKLRSGTQSVIEKTGMTYSTRG